MNKIQSYISSSFNKLRNQPLDFWVKWTATVVALAHVYITAHDIAPYYKYTGAFTAAMWLWLGFLWKQPSLVILNIIMILIYLKGMLINLPV